MDPHLVLEQRVHEHILAKRKEEERTRSDTIWDISKKIGTPELPGNYPVGFIDELRNTPFDWQITVENGTILFLKTFPYESEFYSMQGWEAAYAAVNIDKGNSAVAYRVLLEDHGMDDDMGANIYEGALICEGILTAFEQKMEYDHRYGFVFRGLQRRVEETEGRCGCIIDHLVPEFDKLPALVRQLSGEIYGNFLAAYMLSLEHGKSFENSPQLNFNWPFGRYYLSDATSPQHISTQ